MWKQSSVYIVDGARTPFLKARNAPGPFAASDLAVQAGRALLARQPFQPNELGEVVAGCMMPSPNEANIARVIALRLGCGHHVPAWTVQRNCASGLQALESAAKNILLGCHELTLAGGTEAMSHAPLLFNKGMVKWLGQWYEAKGLLAKLQTLSHLRPGFFAPVIALLGGLTDPLVGLSMGQTAENVAYRFGITREQMDEYAVMSHQRLAAAQDNGYLSEITALYDTAGKIYQQDDGLRRDSSPEKLAKLKPFFDKPIGTVTAANSSQITDGAAFLLLASAEAVKKHELPVLGRIVDIHWGALDPAEMGLGPVHAVTPLLQRNKLPLSEIDYWEINEAFAAQVLGCIRAWESDDYCQKYLGLDKALGSIDLNRLNVDGGAIAVGHPVGASGARITLHLLHTLRRKKAKYGIATLCIGGGQGGAILIENVEGI
ncbi:MAG: acetyl-CoA C-acetyltransferase [Gammaproteobacteria bacterium]